MCVCVCMCVQALAEKSAHWTEKFATDFEAKDAELKALTATRERDLERLNELQARFDRDLADRAAREVRASPPTPQVLAAACYHWLAID